MQEYFIHEISQFVVIEGGIILVFEVKLEWTAASLLAPARAYSYNFRYPNLNKQLMGKRKENITLPQGPEPHVATGYIISGQAPCTLGVHPEEMDGGFALPTSLLLLYEMKTWNLDKAIKGGSSG